MRNYIVIIMILVGAVAGWFLTYFASPPVASLIATTIFFIWLLLLLTISWFISTMIHCYSKADMGKAEKVFKRRSKHFSNVLRWLSYLTLLIITIAFLASQEILFLIIFIIVLVMTTLQD